MLRRHYDTFIVRPARSLLPPAALTRGSSQTEIDFAEIASAGLNWVRLPVPYWAIKKWEGEPFLEKVAWECASSLSCLRSSPFGGFGTKAWRCAHRRPQGGRVGEEVRPADQLRPALRAGVAEVRILFSRHLARRG